MEIPLTLSEFLGVFEAYNRDIEPVQGIAYVSGIVAMVYAAKGGRTSGKAVVFVLSMYWIWTGIMYHIMHFSDVNSGAIVFGMFFVAQGMMLLYAAEEAPGLAFRFTGSAPSVIGAAFIGYAMVAYPLLNYAFGHGYPQMPVFGVSPCPVTIFTFGILLWAEGRVPPYVVAIPFLWSLMGVSAAVSLCVVEDFGLAVAGTAGSALILKKNRMMNRRRTGEA